MENEEKWNDCKIATLCEGLRSDVDNHRDDIKDIYKRLSYVENETASFKSEIKNLCKQIENLVITLRWTAGIVITVGGLLVTIFKH